jgi:hypothetical protein
MVEVLITCPKTGKPVPTGFKMEPDSFDSNQMFDNAFQCPQCSLMHTWSKKDAFLSA